MKENIGNKPIAPIKIAEILKKETDSTHKLSQAEILGKLDRNYNIIVERKTIKRNLDHLIEAGLPVVYDRTGCYWDENGRAFTDGELRLLIDSILFSKHISAKYANDLIEKLRELAPISFRERTKVRADSIDSRTDNPQLFYNIEQLGEAILSGCQVELTQNHYNLRGELVSYGTIKVSPLKMFAHENHYYLYAKDDEKQDLFLRVEKITDIKLLSETSKYVASNKDIAKFLPEHPYMFGGEPEQSRILLFKDKLDDFIDAFGNRFSCTKETSRNYELALKVNPQDLLVWAMHNCMSVEVLEPQSVRDSLRANATALRLKYERTNDDAYSYAIARARQTGNLVLSHCDLRKKRLHQSLTNIRKVVLDDVTITNLDFLEKFDKLQVLNIKNVDITNLNIIEGNTTLRTLMLVDTPIKNIDFLETLPNLTNLVIVGNSNVKDYRILQKLKDLHYLTIDETVVIDQELLGVNINIRVEKSGQRINIEGLSFDLRSPQRLLSKIYNSKYGPHIAIPPVCTERATEEFDAFLTKILTEEQISLMKNNLLHLIPISVLSKKINMSDEYVQGQIDKALQILRLPENRMKIEHIFFGKL